MSQHKDKKIKVRSIYHSKDQTMIMIRSDKVYSLNKLK